MKKLKSLLYLLVLCAVPVRAVITSVFTFPGGVNGSIQVNNNGIFGGDSTFTYDLTTHTLSIATMTVTQSLTVSTLTVNSQSTLNGRTFFANGTAALPSISFVGNSGMGFSRPAGNTLVLSFVNVGYSTFTQTDIVGAQLLTFPGAVLSTVTVTSSATIRGLFSFSGATVSYSPASVVTGTVTYSPALVTNGLEIDNSTVTHTGSHVFSGGITDPSAVHLAGTETISGAKTFTTTVASTGSASAKFSGTTSAGVAISRFEAISDGASMQMNAYGSSTPGTYGGHSIAGQSTLESTQNMLFTVATNKVYSFTVSDGSAQKERFMVDTTGVVLSTDTPINGTGVNKSTTVYSGGHNFTSWETHSGTSTVSGTTTTYSPLGVINGTKLDNSTVTYTGSHTFNGTVAGTGLVAAGSSTTFTGANIFRNGISVTTGPTTTNAFFVGSSSAVTNITTFLKGTSTTDNAPAGYYGEYTSSAVTVATLYPTTGQYGDLASISLTAGDWDVGWNLKQGANGATITDCQYGVGTAAGNSATGMTLGDNSQSTGGATTAYDFSASVAGIRQSVAGTTTIYLKYFCDYSVATPKATGRISARRVR